jgi:uncharacterized protein YndB with AHSA1/START domain
MSALVSRIQIDRSPAEVFSFATDPAHFADWQKDVVEAKVEGDSALRVGAKLTQTRRIGRTRRTFSQKVVESTPPRSWTVRGIDGPIRPGMELTVEPLGDGSRSRVTFRLSFDPQGIGRVFVPLVVRRLARTGAPHSYQNLKKLLERGGGSGATRS